MAHPPMRQGSLRQHQGCGQGRDAMLGLCYSPLDRCVGEAHGHKGIVEVTGAQCIVVKPHCIG
jgi:hypothetical protein